jgi:ABC-type multidrug transport system fused ATPase/permease subunit
MKKKTKPAYGFWENMKFILTHQWRTDKTAWLYTFARAPMAVASAYLTLYLSKETVRAVTEGRTPAAVLSLIAAIGGALLAVMAAEHLLSAGLQKIMMVFDFHCQSLIFNKVTACDYEIMESPAGLTRISKALEHVGSDNRSARMVSEILSKLLGSVLGTFLYAGILISLSPWIFLAVTVTTLSGFFTLRLTSRWDYRNKNNWKTYDRKLDYLRKNSGDFTRAKDMRLYSMSDWFSDVFKHTLDGRMAWRKKSAQTEFAADALRLTLSLVREGVAYTYLTYLIYTQGLPVSDFVLFFGVIAGLSGWLNGVVQEMNNLYRAHLGFCEIREFLDYPDRANHGEGPKLPAGTFEIEFDKVTYRYPGSGEAAVSDVSFKLKKGEKLAVVGLNGAGKTTLVKLMCGLYDPTEGRVLINGTPLTEFNREELYAAFSAVFQDIFVMPFSIARNVSARPEEQTDKRRAAEMLRQAGLWEKTDGLPQGMETQLVKSVRDDALDLSGGEVQKLALARALYMEGRVLLLDEPTAALDPIAESRVYQEYNRMTAGNTSVFISHRLASTRFCDRIFFLENGRVAECGTHDELIAMKGKYCEMYEVQSHYYKEGVL